MMKHIYCMPQVASMRAASWDYLPFWVPHTSYSCPWFSSGPCRSPRLTQSPGAMARGVPPNSDTSLLLNVLKLQTPSLLSPESAISRQTLVLRLPTPL
jgi:hypothetical protein